MGNDLGRGVTGIGKDTRSAKQFTPSLPPDSVKFSESMQKAIENALLQDTAFSAENQQAFREDRPFVRDMLEEDRAMRDTAFADERRYAGEDRGTAAKLLELGLSGYEEDRGMRRGLIGEIGNQLDTMSGSRPTPGAGPEVSENDTLNNLISQIDEALKTGGVGAQMPIISRATEASRMATSNALSQLDQNLSSTGMGRSSYGMRTRADTLMSGERATADIGPRLAEQFINMGANILPGVEQSRNAATKGAYDSASSRYGDELRASGAKESDLLRSLVALITNGGAVPAASPGSVQGAPNPQQVLGFGLQGQAGPAQYLNMGPTGASLISSATSRSNTGANVAAQRDTAEWAAIAQIYSAAISAAGCWVAFAIYGPGPQWALAKFYIFNVWQGRTARAVRATYLRFGPSLARHRRLCRMLKPLFDIAVKRGEQAWAR